MGKHLWEQPPVRFVRWIIFLPLSLTISILLNAFAVHALDRGWIAWPSFTWEYFTRRLLMLGPTLLGAFTWWLAVFLTPWLGCVVIAPNRKVAAPILGTAFCIGQISLVLNRFEREGGLSFGFLGIQLFFTALFLVGVIAAFRRQPPGAPSSTPGSVG